MTEPQVSAADQAQAGQMLEESVPASPDAADEVPGAAVPGDADGDGDPEAPGETEWVGGAAGWSGDAGRSRRGENWDALKRAPTGLLTDGCGKRGGADGRNEGAELAGG